jgi:hypothetical protein
MRIRRLALPLALQAATRRKIVPAATTAAGTNLDRPPAIPVATLAMVALGRQETLEALLAEYLQAEELMVT